MSTGRRSATVGLGERADAVLMETEQEPAVQTQDLMSGDDGMSTAEYAVGTLAACAFAAVLYAVTTSGEVHRLVLSLVIRALGSVT
jgi:hypothetical protein